MTKQAPMDNRAAIATLSARRGDIERYFIESLFARLPESVAEFLTRIVLEGSNPYSSHWKGKVSGLSMPPNAVAITEGNARLLVNWILALH